jgi:tRNA modification GTPase
MTRLQSDGINNTIAAISTPLGEGGIAVVRVSGPDTFAVVDRCFEPVGKSSCRVSSAPSHTLQYGFIVANEKRVDEVLVAVMKAPRTFTREDVVEISCHGGLLVAKLVLGALLAAGARLAHPGEFTQRAFLNGRIDLAQAEAVADIIHARTELALAAAEEQLAGKLSHRIHQLRDDLMRTLAHVEAHIDFPDEDITPDTRSELVRRMRDGVAFMDQLLKTAVEGQILRRGIRAAIIGRPNVGKSSLLNLLLGRDRAIVSPIPGTTRDTIEETANIRGIPVMLVDTAGMRAAGDSLEAEGIRRSRQALAHADLILHILDQSEELASDDREVLDEFAGRKRILVANKTDLPSRLSWPPELADLVVRVSCTNGEGIEELKDAIKGRFWAGEIRVEMLEVMINTRHQDALRRAKEACVRSLEALDQELTLEMVALDLRIAAGAVGEVVGKTATEDLLDTIFSQFCIGK